MVGWFIRSIVLLFDRSFICLLVGWLVGLFVGSWVVRSFVGSVLRWFVASWVPLAACAFVDVLLLSRTQRRTLDVRSTTCATPHRRRGSLRWRRGAGALLPNRIRSPACTVECMQGQAHAFIHDGNSACLHLLGISARARARLALSLASPRLARNTFTRMDVQVGEHDSCLQGKPRHGAGVRGAVRCPRRCLCGVPRVEAVRRWRLLLVP